MNDKLLRLAQSWPADAAAKMALQISVREKLTEINTDLREGLNKAKDRAKHADDRAQAVLDSSNEVSGVLDELRTMAATVMRERNALKATLNLVWGEVPPDFYGGDPAEPEKAVAKLAAAWVKTAKDAAELERLREIVMTRTGVLPAIFKRDLAKCIEQIIVVTEADRQHMQEQKREIATLRELLLLAIKAEGAASSYCETLRREWSEMHDALAAAGIDGDQVVRKSKYNRDREPGGPLSPENLLELRQQALIQSSAAGSGSVSVDVRTLAALLNAAEVS